MFSSITIASSTTKPTASVSAISDRLSMLKLSTDITENVPMIAIGSVRLGIIVATALRRKKKITATTSTSATSSENFTSATALLIEIDRSYCRCTLSVGGKPFSISASVVLDAPRDLDRVRARLALDHQVDGALVVVPARRLVVLDVVEHVRDVAEPHGARRCDRR